MLGDLIACSAHKGEDTEDLAQVLTERASYAASTSARIHASPPPPLFVCVCVCVCVCLCFVSFFNRFIPQNVLDNGPLLRTFHEMKSLKVTEIETLVTEIESEA